MKKTALAITLLLFTGLTAAQITFDDSSNIEFQTGLDLNNNNIVDYFDRSACGSGDYIENIQDDGTIVCSNPSGSTPKLSQVLDQGATANQNIAMNGHTLTGLTNPSNNDEPVTLGYLENNFEASGSQNLSQVLEEGNVANQSVSMRDYLVKSSEFGIEIGNANTVVGSNSGSGSPGIAIGKDAEATAVSGVGAPAADTAIGDSAYASGANTVPALALGAYSEADNTRATAIGSRSKALGNGAVAIGYSANAPNSYEATFGNLNGNELDINVTGNATVHEGLRMPNGVEVGDTASADIPGDTAVGKGAEASGGSDFPATAVGTNSTASGLWTSAFGYESTASIYASSAFGYDSTASATSATAIGHRSNASALYASAFGRDSTSSAEGAFAFGLDSISDESYTARFGSDSQAYDVDVTGDLNVDGSLTGVSTGGSASGLSEVLAQNNTANQSIEFSNGVELGDGSTFTDGADQIAIGKESATEGGDAIAFGKYAYAPGGGSMAYGYSSESSGSNSIALGEDAYASGYRSIAIGYNSRSPTNNEVTFGNLNGEELDLNVTGNATVHGSGGLRMPNGVTIGDTDTSTIDSSYENAIAIGHDASIDGTYATALGKSSNAGGPDTLVFGREANTGSAAFNAIAAGRLAKASSANDTAVGPYSQASGENSVAIGPGASAPSYRGIALGKDSSTEGYSPGAVAIGYDSVSNEQYTARFGSSSQAYDVDVTGDLNVGGELTGVSTGGGSPEGLSETLAAGNVANQTIEFDSSTGVQIGDGSTSTFESSSVAVGKSSTAVGPDAVAIGQSAKSNAESAITVGNAEVNGAWGTAVGDGASAGGIDSVALGSSAETNENGAVAIGVNSNAPNANEATFGNLNGQELDVNVTGNATIHGSGGLDIPTDTDVQLGGGVSSSGMGPGSRTVVGNFASASGSTASAYGGSSEASGLGVTALGGLSEALADEATAVGYDATSSGAGAVALGESTTASKESSVAVGNSAFSTAEDGIALGGGATSSGVDSTALGFNSQANSEGAVAIGLTSVADESYTVELGSSSQAYDLNVNGGSIAVGSNSQSGLSSGDINASDIYYDTLTAKSPVVSCSAGTDWCEVSEPSEQSHYFVKKSDNFDKDRPRETALEVVESDVETVQKFEELREENENQEKKLQELNSTVQALKSAVCEDNPEKEVCGQ